MNEYKALNKQVFTAGAYSIVPLRMQDRYDIMQWRNEQQYHLRQNESLTKASQDTYFNKVVAKLFDKENPDQILFSYLNGERCIGYGGLVHINWVDKNAEVSFVMDTKLESEEFEKHWGTYLGLIGKTAFEELQLHKIYTYAFDLRPKLYKALESAEFSKEAVLKEHCLFGNEFIDVFIHCKYKRKGFLTFREALQTDAKLFYHWANDDEVRNNALNNEKIEWQNHLHWFSKKIKSKNSFIYLFYYQERPIGQVRLDKNDDCWKIDYSVDRSERGKGYGAKMLKKILREQKGKILVGFVKPNNIGSNKVFEKLNFTKSKVSKVEGTDLIKYKIIT